MESVQFLDMRIFFLATVDNFLTTLSRDMWMGMFLLLQVAILLDGHAITDFQDRLTCMFMSVQSADQGGSYLKAGTANLPSEAVISSACGTSGISHRYLIPVSISDLMNGKKFFVHGISAVSGYSNKLLENGGKFDTLPF
jgi:hypothetical protein